MLSPLFRVHLSTVFHLSLSPPTLLLFFATAFRSLPQSAASPRMRATPAKADEHPALVFTRPTDRLVRVNQFSITAQPGEQDGVTDRRSKAERRDAEHQPSPRGRSLDRTIRFYRPAPPHLGYGRESKSDARNERIEADLFDLLRPATSKTPIAGTQISRRVRNWKDGPRRRAEERLDTTKERDERGKNSDADRWIRRYYYTSLQSYL